MSLYNRNPEDSTKKLLELIIKFSKVAGYKIYTHDSCTTMFIAALFTIARTWKQPKCPSTDEWIKKMWHIYTMEYYSAIKRNETESFVETWMDLETVIKSEVSQKEKNKYHILMHICGT